MSEFSIRVLVADDQPAVLAGLEQLLASVKTIQLVGMCDSSTALIASLERSSCDVLVSDYAMPGGSYGDGIELFSFVQRHYPDVRLVVLTMIEDASVIRLLLKQSISSIISKADATSHIVAAIHSAYARGTYMSPTVDAIASANELESPGGTELSAREVEVIRLFALGLSIDEIALRVGRSKQTVSTHKASAMRKIGATSDVDLLRYANETKMAAFAANPQR